MALGHSKIEFFGKLHFCTSKTVDLATVSFFKLFGCLLKGSQCPPQYILCSQVQYVFFGVLMANKWGVHEGITMYFLVFLWPISGGSMRGSQCSLLLIM